MRFEWGLIEIGNIIQDYYGINTLVLEFTQSLFEFCKPPSR